MSRSPSGTAAAPSPFHTLRRLYLTLFLRGGARTGQAHKRSSAAFTTLGGVLFFYALFGCIALVLKEQPVFSIAAYLHATTFVLVAIFLTVHAADVLFNSQEADTLLFRPIQPRALLGAKIAALSQLAIYLAWAFNLVGTLLGMQAPDGDWRFLPVHALSTALEALLCCGCVVLVYQLCLKWFGRERLEGLMTLAQVGVSVLLVLANQLLPRIVSRVGTLLPGPNRPWLLALPPAWFAGFDDALASHGGPFSWVLASLACGVTVIVLCAALGKLAGDYAQGLQRLADVSRPALAVDRARRWMRGLLATPPISWWLRRRVERALCLLTLAYLFRDRDVKLRVYPALVWTLFVPFFRGATEQPVQGLCARLRRRFRWVDANDGAEAPAILAALAGCRAVSRGAACRACCADGGCTAGGAARIRPAAVCGAGSDCVAPRRRPPRTAPDPRARDSSGLFADPLEVQQRRAAVSLRPDVHRHQRLPDHHRDAGRHADFRPADRRACGARAAERVARVLLSGRNPAGAGGPLDTAALDRAGPPGRPSHERRDRGAALNQR